MVKFLSKTPSRNLKRSASCPPAKKKRSNKRQRSNSAITADSEEDGDCVITATHTFRRASVSKIISKTIKKQPPPRKQVPSKRQLAIQQKAEHIRFQSDTVESETEDDTEDHRPAARSRRPQLPGKRAESAVSPRTPSRVQKNRAAAVLQQPLPGTPGSVERPIDVDKDDDKDQKTMLRAYPYAFSMLDAFVKSQIPQDPRPLQNDGNMSYCNAILQLLLNIPTLTSILASYGENYHCKHPNSVLSTLHDMSIDYRTPSMAPYEASKQSLMRCASARGWGPWQSPKGQTQDAAGFLELVIREVKRDLEVQPLQERRKIGAPRRKTMVETWQALFCTELVKESNCDSCDVKKTEIAKDNAMLSFKFPTYQGKNIQRLLEESLNTPGDDWVCTSKRCKRRHEAGETPWQQSFQSLPEVLFIRRADFKLDNVVLPFHFRGDEVLDLEQSLHPDRQPLMGPAKYQICGAISYSPTARVVGQTGNGRYVTVVRVGNEWWECNDTNVQKTDIVKWGQKEIPEKLLYNVMLLAFRRIDEEENNDTSDCIKSPSSRKVVQKSKVVDKSKVLSPEDVVDECNHDLLPPPVHKSGTADDVSSELQIKLEAIESHANEVNDETASTTPLALLSGPISLQGKVLGSEAFIQLALHQLDQLPAGDQTLITQASGYHEGHTCIMSLSGTFTCGEDIVAPSGKSSKRFCRTQFKKGQDWPSLYKLHVDQSQGNSSNTLGADGSSDDINKLRIELSKVLSENAQLKAQRGIEHKDCIEERTALEEKLAEIQPTPFLKAREVASLNDANRSLKEQCTKLRAENAQLTSEREMNQQAVDNMIKAYQKVEEEKQAALAQALQHEEECGEQEEVISTMKKQIKDLKRQIKDSQAQSLQAEQSPKTMKKRKSSA